MLVISYQAAWAENFSASGSGEVRLFGIQCRQSTDACTRVVPMPSSMNPLGMLRAAAAARKRKTTAPETASAPSSASSGTASASSSASSSAPSGTAPLSAAATRAAAAEAIASARQDQGSSAVDLQGSADDMQKLQLILIEQTRVLVHCRAKIKAIKAARTAAGGGSGGGAPNKTEKEAIRLYERRMEGAWRVLHGKTAKDQSANELAFDGLCEAARCGQGVHARYGTRARELREQPKGKQCPSAGVAAFSGGHLRTDSRRGRRGGRRHGRGRGRGRGRQTASIK